MGKIETPTDYPKEKVFRRTIHYSYTLSFATFRLKAQCIGKNSPCEEHEGNVVKQRNTFSNPDTKRTSVNRSGLLHPCLWKGSSAVSLKILEGQKKKSRFGRSYDNAISKDFEESLTSAIMAFL